jgi:hypothetical protein
LPYFWILFCDLVRIGCSLGGADSIGWTWGTSDFAWIGEEAGGEWERLELVGIGKGFEEMKPETIARIIGREKVLEVGRFEEDTADCDVDLEKGNTDSRKTTSRDINIRPESWW